MRVAYLVGGGRGDEAEPLLQELRRRGPRLPDEALERVADALEEVGRLREAMRWFTIGLRDLDRSRTFRLRGGVRAHGPLARARALDLPPDHYDVLARETLDARRARWTDDGD